MYIFKDRRQTPIDELITKSSRIIFYTDNTHKYYESAVSMLLREFKLIVVCTIYRINYNVMPSTKLTEHVHSSNYYQVL
jgi:hypothetical protein